MVPVPATILITGSNRGLGLELVKQWAKYPGVKHIFACARRISGASDLQALSKADLRIRCIQLDVTCDADIKEAKNQVKKILGEGAGLNLLINNAGIRIDDGGVLLNCDRSVYLQHFNTNAVSVAKVIEVFHPLLKIAADKSDASDWGVHHSAIVNISGRRGSIALNTDGSQKFKNIAYRLSKAALNQLTRTLAVDLADDKILVVSMCPGWMRTAMGGPEATYEVDDAARRLIETSLTLQQSHSGTFVNSLGETCPF